MSSISHKIFKLWGNFEMTMNIFKKKMKKIYIKYIMNSKKSEILIMRIYRRV